MHLFFKTVKTVNLPATFLFLKRVHKYTNVSLCTLSQNYDNDMKKFIAYYRVSTDKQGTSGLGLEAQRNQVETFARNAGEIISEYVEVESGKKNDRPQLKSALKQCKKTGAVLVVAKLDRLSRTLSLIAQIMESGAEFVAADNPHANKFTIHILAAVAEFERDQISARTKAALAAAKERGVKLGTHGKVLAAENKASADEYAKKLRPIIEEIRDAGHTSVRAIASELNRKGIETARGGSWHPNTVQRILKRIERLATADQLTLKV